MSRTLFSNSPGGSANTPGMSDSRSRFTADSATPRMGVVVVNKKIVYGGDYGIGMKVDVSAPHAVQRVTSLRDKGGGDVSSRVAVGDNLFSVDGTEVAGYGSGWIRQLILGEKDSVVSLKLRSLKTNALYELMVLPCPQTSTSKGAGFPRGSQFRNAQTLRVNAYTQPPKVKNLDNLTAPRLLPPSTFNTSGNPNSFFSKVSFLSFPGVVFTKGNQSLLVSAIK